ncbi:MAG: hypothetical protein K2I85_01825 [Alistipes sp.]|nr:hypothetical protein [Alistipes sp.]
MKKNYLRWTAMLFAGLSLTISSCTDSDADGTEPTNPIFPEAVEAAIMPGDTYTLRFETMLDWEASIPASVAQAFYIQDGTQQTIRTQGKAGKAEVEIGCYDIASFDDDLSCEVTLTMAKQSKVIATLTINKQERALMLRTSKVEDGSFVYGSDDLRYEYNEEPAENIDLIWPAGNSGYMYPIMVEANFAWRLAEKSEWIADADYVGEAGQQVEILLRADPTKYPLDGDEDGKFVLCARNNAGMKYEYKVTIPACRDHFSVSGFAAESRFNAKGLFYSAGSSSAGAWIEGGMHGEIVSVEEPVIYKFAEVSESEGFSYLEAEESQTAWIKIESALEDADNVLKTRRYTVTVEENTSDDARKGVILALPASVAATLEGAWELAEMDIKEEYQQYIVTRLNQYPKPDLVSAVNPEGMTEVGAALERLDPEGYSLLMENFGVTDGFNLLYTKAWSNEDSTLAFEREYTSYKCYNYDLDEMTGNASWLTVEKTANGTVINMDPSKDTCGGSSQMNEGVAHAGFIVFADAEGDFVLIRCVYDESMSVGGDDGEVKVAFYYPEYALQYDESTLELLTSGPLFEEYNPGNGTPVYHLTYRRPYASMSMLKGLSNMAMAYPSAEWIEYEPQGDMSIITMNAEALGDAKTMTGHIIFYNSSWETAVTIVCTLDLTDYKEEE